MSDNPLVRRGSEGEWVRYLQDCLTARGFDVGSHGVDGDFGPDTEAAVRAYQEWKGLHVDGIVGEDTWGMLEADGGATSSATETDVAEYDFEPEVVTGTWYELPTANDADHGGKLLEFLVIDPAARDATEFASLFNEYAKYDGGEEGKATFIDSMPDFAKGDLVEGIGKWVVSYLIDTAAIVNADEVAALRYEFFRHVAAGAAAALAGNGPPGAPHPFMVIAQDAAWEAINARDYEEQRMMAAFLVRMDWDLPSRVEDWDAWATEGNFSYKLTKYFSDAGF